MECIPAGDEVEVLNDFARWRDGLRANTRAAVRQIVRLNLWDEPLKRSAKDIAAEGAPQLVPAHRRVLEEEPPESRVGQGVEEIARAEIALAIAFACKRQHRIGSRLD